MSLDRRDSHSFILCASVATRWLLLLGLGAAAACGTDDTPSEQGDPGDIVRMARCQRGLEDFLHGSQYNCDSPGEARETFRAFGIISFSDYACRGKGDAPRAQLSFSDGTGSANCIFDAATDQLVGARLTSDAEDFCEKSSRSVTFGEDPSDCTFYPGQSCPPFARGEEPPFICVLPEPCAEGAPACEAAGP